MDALPIDVFEPLVCFDLFRVMRIDVPASVILMAGGWGKDAVGAKSGSVTGRADSIGFLL